MTGMSFDSLGFMRDVIAGVFMLAVVLAFHGLCMTHIAFRYELDCRLSLARNKPRRVIVHFYLAIMALALVHVAAIVGWAAALAIGGLVADFTQAILFSGSCYTTLGFMDNILPVGWKAMALIITISGLFSMAWSTSMMISMTDHFRQAWARQHADLVKQIIDSENNKGQ